MVKEKRIITRVLISLGYNMFKVEQTTSQRLTCKRLLRWQELHEIHSPVSNTCTYLSQTGTLKNPPETEPPSNMLAEDSSKSRKRWNKVRGMLKRIGTSYTGKKTLSVSIHGVLWDFGTILDFIENKGVKKICKWLKACEYSTIVNVKPRLTRATSFD